MGVFAVSGAVSVWHYFVDWAGSPAVALAYNAPLVDLATAANERAALGEGVLLPPATYGNPVVAFLILPTCPRMGGLAPDGPRLPADAALLIPPDYAGENAFVWLTAPVARFSIFLGPETTRWLQEGGGAPVHGRWDSPIARTAPAAGTLDDTRLVGLRALNAVLGDQVRLSSYDLGGSDKQRPRIIPGAAISLTVYWEAPRQPTADYWAFVHVLDPEDRAWSGWNGPPVSVVFPTGAWRPGEHIPVVYRVPVAPDVPPGKYMLEIGLYHPFTGARLDVVAADGAPLGSRALLGPLKVAADDTRPIGPPITPAQANLGWIELIGCDVEPESLAVKPGDKIRVALHWRGLALMDTDYTVFVHLTDAAGQPVAQHDSPPRYGRYPTSIWDADEAVLDVHEFVAPADLAPGAYCLIAGLYDPVTGARLPVLDDAGQPIGDHVLLATITVQP